MSGSGNPFSPDERSLNPFAMPVIAPPDASELALGSNPFDDEESFHSRSEPAAAPAAAEPGAESDPGPSPFPADAIPQPPPPMHQPTPQPAAAVDAAEAEAVAPTIPIVGASEEASGEAPPELARSESGASVDEQEEVVEPPAVEVDPPTFAADVSNGCAALLESGRYSDLLFVMGDGTSAGQTQRAHRVVLELRCGPALVQALEKGAVGDVAHEEGTLRMRLPEVGGSVMHVLLRFLYLEQFEAHLLTPTKLAISGAVTESLAPAAAPADAAGAGAGAAPIALGEEELLALRCIDGAPPLEELFPCEPTQAHPRIG